jgi:hypothetical protein
MTADTMIGICLLIFLAMGVMISFEMGNHARECENLTEQLKKERQEKLQALAREKVWHERYLQAVLGRTKSDK